MRKRQFAFIALICIWMGVALGANLVAAPAKFTVTTLSTSQLVSVGRVQFIFVGYVELCLAALGGLALIWSNVRETKGLSATIALFGAALLLLLAQRFAIHPQLISDPSGWLHKAYVVMEVAKVICLAGLVGLYARKLQ